MKRLAAAALSSAFALISTPWVFAQDMPMAKIFHGMQGQKGQWKVDLLETDGKARGGKMPQMTICTDNLMRQSSPGAAKDKPRADSGCKHRLLKDTANEAVMESTCPERKSTVTVTREGKSMLMTMTSTGAQGPQTMKMRYTHLGPCREGQGTVSLDKDSEQCKKIRAQAAKMDPVKTCARQKSERETCEKQVRDAAAQILGMCS